MRQELKIKKADIVLAVIFIAAAVALFAWSFTYFTDGGNSVTVTADGELLATYQLSENCTVIVENGAITEEVSGTPGADVNIITIKDGKIWMESASCKNQHCVLHTAISLGNEQIVCLPNKVIVQITDDGESEIDTVAN